MSEIHEPVYKLRRNNDNNSGGWYKSENPLKIWEIFTGQLNVIVTKNQKLRCDILLGKMDTLVDTL